MSGLTPRSRFLRALGRETGEYLPLSVQFAPTKLEEFRSANGGADPYEFFALDYRHVGVPAPNSLPDFHRYFEGRVPDWTDYTDAGLDPVPFRGSSYYSMGPGGTAMNEWGEYRIYEKSGDYHKKIYPLAGENTRMADIEAYPMPDYHAQSRYDGVADSIRKVHDQGLAAVLSWEMTIFEKAWRIRGLEDLMMDFILHPDLAECLMDRISAQTGKLAAEYGRLGIDVIQLGDDIGSQNGMMISPEIYREFLKPRMEKLVGDIRRANPDTLVFYHSDGDVSPVISDFVDVGIDILNPVQRECMDIASIKKRYGDNLSFWGGLSVQRTLPFGAPAEVAAETREIARVAGKGGGLVIAPGHLVERDIPLENVYVYAETVRKINGEAE